jgi:hypothetical protein
MRHPIIEATLRQVCDILLASRRGIVSDTEAVSRIRAQIFRPSVQDAASRSGDTVFAFALRGLYRILSDRAESPREILTRMCDCINLTASVGDKNQQRRTIWIRKRQQ